MKGLILAGGYGTRLRPLTYSQQKQLIPVANKPILFYGIEEIIKAGIAEIGIIVGPNKEQVKDAINNAKFDAEISFIEQEVPLGIGHAVKISEKFVGDDSFVVYLGDNLLKGGIVQHVKHFVEGDMDASILLTPYKNPSLFGCAELREDGSIKRLVEKPKNPPSNLVMIGVYLFKSSIFEAVKNIKPSWRNEIEITDAVQYLIENNFKVHSDIVNGWWKDTGKPEDILEANQLILDELEPHNDGFIGEGVVLRGKVGIGEGSTVKSGSVIKGPVIIGKDCKIGPQTYIGPYTSIGDKCEIVTSEIESSIIMDGSKISCKRKVVDSLIGRRVRISERSHLPRGQRLIIGDASEVDLWG
jgi:glucose-1-phosphate thymidylyltransferase